MPRIAAVFIPACILWAECGWAQVFDEPAQQQAFDPGKLYENFFGQTAAEADAELEKVQISASEERRFGQSIVDAYLEDLRRQGLEVVDRGQDVAYLTALVGTLKPFMTNKDRYKAIKVYVVDSDKVDARSFPGGTLVFFRGLLDFADSEAAVVGVVGHELSHLDHGHQLISLRRMKHFEQTVSSGEQDSGPASMMTAFRTMMSGFARPFRPEDESEADRDGASWAFRAGYDPRELGALFMKMHRQNGQRMAQLPAFLQTHPFNADRNRAIEKQFVQLRRNEADPRLYLGRRNLLERTPRAQQDYEDE